MVKRQKAGRFSFKEERMLLQMASERASIKFGRRQVETAGIDDPEEGHENGSFPEGEQAQASDLVCPSGIKRDRRS